ncbi:hypothetical protein ACFL5U_03570 [Candidatus Margulisiibacteriota bacterium]
MTLKETLTNSQIMEAEESARKRLESDDPFEGVYGVYLSLVGALIKGGGK